MSGNGGNDCSTGGRPRGSKRSKEAASQAKALERGTGGIEKLAVVNAAVEVFKLPSSMPANVQCYRSGH
jgi:hypothetical protein